MSESAGVDDGCDKKSVFPSNHFFSAFNLPPPYYHHPLGDARKASSKSEMACLLACLSDLDDAMAVRQSGLTLHLPCTCTSKSSNSGSRAECPGSYLGPYQWESSCIIQCDSSPLLHTLVVCGPSDTELRMREVVIECGYSCLTFSLTTMYVL